MAPSIQPLSSQYAQRIQQSQPQHSSLSVVDREQVVLAEAINSVAKLKQWAGTLDRAATKLRTEPGGNKMLSNTKQLAEVIQQICLKATLGGGKRRPMSLADMLSILFKEIGKIKNEVNQYAKNPKINLKDEIAKLNKDILKNIVPILKDVYFFLTQTPAFISVNRLA